MESKLALIKKNLSILIKADPKLRIHFFINLLIRNQIRK